MEYIYADIVIEPYSETASDILSAMLGEIGYDSFEMTDKGLKAYIPKEEFDQSLLDSVIDNMFVENTQYTYSIQSLENKDWNEQWEKEHFDPILEREFGIKLNPRMAFGSGSHDTTYQITSLLLSLDFTNQRVLDMGTGTGVLAIAMAMRGAKDVVAIDIDEFSVENAKENFELNHFEALQKAQIILGDATKIDGVFDTIVANIHKNILKADMPTYINHLTPDGTLIISGFYSEDVEEMRAAAIANHLSVAEVIERNNWTVMMLKKS